MRSQERHTRKKFTGVLIALGLAVAACGSDSDSTSESADTAAPAETEVPADTEAPVGTEAPPETQAPADTEATPERVISLSPTHTEIMFAIGAGDQLVAVDQFSNFPAEALDLPNELSGFEPNIEEIAAFEPDLVLIGGDFTGLGDQLAELGIASWDGPAAATIEDTYAQIEQLGAATGHVGDAAEVVSSMQTQLAETLAAAPATEEPLKIYHEVDSTYFSADSTTFIGEAYSAFGLENIADRAEGDNFGFPQLNAEVIISSNPDLIFVPCGNFCTTTADDVGARPGWDAISAVQNGNVIEADEDIASRWGPRIVEYYAAVAAAIQQAAVAV
ncbi:MAG: ABC transporter substrate-binding protein [Ilumatobacter sp.]|jgi:iron complex transport system substrate-binding protein|uniref:ABC transporter substrate-binding protein n=1 Tax=Ilumatobacter sp. TaxID=1967498 RepID=UPI001DC0EEBC|nr:ABC transporter substrate-binding protein [Ilumatobacter sp.]MBT5277861.1 ABC transporter substrate-binding protein [Ilumatobacter sp.]MBT5552162.1 ABC transporter substrate-binding protein [Ilumatobacter sp.]MBT5864528.1 ABC transporter substrate-binding protein [Ilumatobacter sp.]MBT7428469.1 ABC transporter substrate-binding protein [Ilumatobacter sp.]